jgi:hypothetical protein
VADVVEAVRESVNDPSAKTILLTGRTTIYEARIKEILASAGLQFDYYGEPSSTTTSQNLLPLISLQFFLV